MINSSLSQITLGGGCFWCLEAVFDGVRGVTDVISGYAGGQLANPTYEAVCSGLTGHAEVVQITFDSTQISLEDVLHIFFSIHDPTTLNRQGNDIGTQYRSVIFYHTAEQKQAAEQVLAELTAAKLWDRPIVTQVVALKNFYPAEDYHQEYFARNPGQGYCRAIIAPKVAKFRQKYAGQIK